MFMNELLYRSIHGEMPDPELYHFVHDSIERLDEMTNNLAGFPILFTLQLATYLGLAPHNNYSETNCYFDLQEGNFSPLQPDHPQSLLPPYSHALARLLNLGPGESDLLDPPARNVMLGKLLDYYRLHLPSFGEMKSPQVLNTVLKD